MFVKPSTWATSLRQLYLNRCAPHTSCLGTNLPKPMQNNVSGCCGSLQPYACMVAARGERQANLYCTNYDRMGRASSKVRGSCILDCLIGSGLEQCTLEPAYDC